MSCSMLVLVIMKVILFMYFMFMSQFFRTWDWRKRLLWLIILLIGKRTAILISYHVRFSTYACNCGDYYWCSPSKDPFLFKALAIWIWLLASSWWYQGTAEILDSQSDFKQWLHQCKLHKGRVHVFGFFFNVSPFYCLSEYCLGYFKKLKSCMKPAVYWGQQSCNIYFYSRSPGEDIWGFLGNGLSISVSCNCHGHSIR